MMTIASLALALLATGASTDTTFSVRSGSRLDVNNFAGSIAIHAWGRNDVRIQAAHSSRVQIEVESSSSTIAVRARSRRGAPASVDYQISAPSWMALELSGIATDVAIDGTKGEVKVSTVNGDVDVRGGAKFISLASVEGDVRLVGGRGRMELSSVNQDIQVSDSNGDVIAETVNGDVTLESVQSQNVEASTVNGTVTYDGTVKEDGSYTFSTHSGDIVFGLGERANAAVSVATFSGEFESSFPITVTETRKGKRFNFTLGNGSARVELESFQGSIQIRRPGETRSSIKDKSHKKNTHDPDDGPDEDEED